MGKKKNRKEKGYLLGDGNSHSNNNNSDSDHNDNIDHHGVDGNHQRVDDRDTNVTTKSMMMTTTTTTTSTSALDFAQRRELQRRAAQEKRRAKMKCYLCGSAGHVRRECPGILDDGRGMSQFKAHYSDTKMAVSKHKQQRKPKKQKKQNSCGSDDTIASVLEENQSSSACPWGLELPNGFLRNATEPKDNLDDDDDDDDGGGGGGDGGGDDDSNNQNDDNDDDDNMHASFCYYDTNCDISATLTYLKSGRGKKRISHTEAMQELQLHLEYAFTKSNLGGIISRSWLRKRRPWVSPFCSPSSSSSEESEDVCFLNDYQGTRLFFVVGLSPMDFTFSSSSSTQGDTAATINEQDDAMHALTETAADHSSVIAGFFADLDYTPEVLTKKGCDREAQLERLRCTAKAAGTSNLALQIQVRPGISSVTAVAGSPYANVLLDLQEVLSDSLRIHPSLKIHLSAWSGDPTHMMTFTKAFPTLMIGLDSHVTFHKATYLHECAFEIDTSQRLVVESNNTIPSEVANRLGRHSFSHSGLIPYICEAIAKHNPLKGSATTTEANDDGTDSGAMLVAQMTALTARQLYPILPQL
jgi:Tat protein secretion system quality control protein TatD with DNase activity